MSELRDWRLAPYDSPEEKGITFYFKGDAMEIVRLLKAAPEILEAAKSYIGLKKEYASLSHSDYGKGHAYYVAERQRRQDALEAAIAKAEGRE